MKKMLNIALGYTIAGMMAGVFYREFTKFNDFVGETALATVHTHLFALGMLMFLIIALFTLKTNLLQVKNFNRAIIIYNVGVFLSTIMMFVRGVTTVLNIQLSSGLNASISGIAGLSHATLAIGLVLIILCLKKIETN